MYDLVRSYYAQIRSLLRDQPDLRPYLKRCRHCRIFFFTDARNAGRDDLRCGFGCREAHRRACSTRRSVEFHRQHKDKKRVINRRRYLIVAQVTSPVGGQLLCRGEAVVVVADRRVPLAFLKYLGVIVGLIEGRHVGVCEIVRMLSRNGRQPRMVRRRRDDYGRRRANDRGS